MTLSSSSSSVVETPTGAAASAIAITDNTAATTAAAAAPTTATATAATKTATDTTAPTAAAPPPLPPPLANIATTTTTTTTTTEVVAAAILDNPETAANAFSGLSVNDDREGIRSAAQLEEEKAKNTRAVLFTLAHVSETPFLVGAKGRNMALIRHHTGVSLFIDGLTVFMVPQRAKANVELARRLALSAAAGGILRWFVHPQATRDGFPPTKAAELKALAGTHACELITLRSRRGHVCLLVVPRLVWLNANTPEMKEALLMQARANTRCAREALLLQLPCAIPSFLGVSPPRSPLAPN